MFIKPEPFDENKTSKHYYDDIVFNYKLFNFVIIFAWLISLIFVFEHYQANVFNGFWQEIWYCLKVIGITTSKFVVAGFFYLAIVIPFCQKASLLKYLIFIIVIFLGIVGFRMYDYYDKTKNILCYTVNYEKYHLYEDCYFLESSENIESVECENIHDINICSLCQWHLETSQKIQKYEY